MNFRNFFNTGEKLDSWEEFLGILNLQCATCGAVPNWQLMRETGSPRGICFYCHGSSEFLEISEGMLNKYGRRNYAGWQPFDKARIKRIAESKQQWDGSISWRERLEGIKPVCDVCNRVVSRTTIYRDEMRRNTVFQFGCHREQAELRVPDNEVMLGDFPRWLANYRPFAAPIPVQDPWPWDGKWQAVQGGLGPTGPTGATGPTGPTGPTFSPFDRPSQATADFMTKLIADMKTGLISSDEALRLATISNAPVGSTSSGVTFIPFDPPRAPEPPKPPPVEVKPLEDKPRVFNWD